MKLSKFICDRCSVVEEQLPVCSDFLPEGWEDIKTKLLCGKCSQDLDAFLRGARIEYVAVENPMHMAAANGPKDQGIKAMPR